jgi:1,4-dihydroxy-2-naphthoate octaprenyltransferase
MSKITLNTTVCMQAIRAPFLVTSIIPVLLALAIAVYLKSEITWAVLPVLIIGVLSVHALTNLTNEYHDFKNGIDTKDSETEHVLVNKSMSLKYVEVLGVISFVIALAAGIIIFLIQGLPILIIGIVGIIGGYFYTAPPFSAKYNAWGEIMVFVLMGPLLFIGSYISLTGVYENSVILISLPMGFLITAVLHGNNLRDINRDKSAGIKTVSNMIGFNNSSLIYSFLIIMAYVTVFIGVLMGYLSFLMLSVCLSLPIAVNNIKAVLRRDPQMVGCIDAGS